MSEPTVYRTAIFLSAYGNCAYFSAQLASITAQMEPEDILVVVDDGSRTVPWQSVGRWPDNYLIWCRLQSMGATRSFLALILDTQVRADAYFLADQDDVWLPGKLAHQFAVLASHGPGPSACTHGWTHTCKAPLQTAARPLISLSVAHYCFETPAPGMTLSFNLASRQILIAQQAVIAQLAEYLPHDRILFAFFSVQAPIHILNDPLVYYRQHANNLVGAPEQNFVLAWTKRVSLPLRTWRTLKHGQILYQSLTKSSSQQVTTDLASMRLRSRAFENGLIHAALRWRAAVAQWLARWA